jgi:hypothetical protein
MITVAALYCDRLGVYPGLPGVDCWTKERDARLYDGPWPVVAHPPCGPWGALRHLYRGDEHDCAPRALAQVHAFGGVLEHPAGSKFWDAASLPKPGENWSDYSGHAVEVEQVEWGHVARKRTWLYLVGVPRSAIEAPPFPGRQPTHYASGGRTSSSRTGGAVPPGMKVCSAQQRNRTPVLFAGYLVRLARAAGEARRAA